MRILRIADVPNNRSGGMSRVMYSTGDALEQAGHQLDYAFSDDLGAATPIRLRRFVYPCRLPRLVARKQLAGLPFDVVEIHEPLSAIYCLARKLNPRLPPLVVISYGVEARGRRAMLDYRRAKGLSVSLKRRYSPLTVVWQGLYGLRHAAAVICFNTEDADFLRRNGLPEERIVCAHSGVSPAFLRAGAERAASPGPARNGILFLGTWIERKGILDLTAAAIPVLRKHPAERLTIAGCGVPVCSVLASFPVDLHGRIEVIPHLDGDQALVEVYRRHAIYVLPSYFEGQPLSMLEAAALGLGIITTDICGMRDFIVHGENGLLMKPGDAEGLERCLERLLQDPAETGRLGQAAREKVQALTWESAASKMLRAYQAARS